MLPGTNRAADRFGRASFYINAIPKTDAREAVAASFTAFDHRLAPALYGSCMAGTVV